MQQYSMNSRSNTPTWLDQRNPRPVMVCIINSNCCLYICIETSRWFVQFAIGFNPAHRPAFLNAGQVTTSGADPDDRVALCQQEPEPSSGLFHREAPQGAAVIGLERRQVELAGQFSVPGMVELAEAPDLEESSSWIFGASRAKRISLSMLMKSLWMSSCRYPARRVLLWVN